MCLQGGYAGNALGFKVASLTKLMDTRANKPRITLLHHLVAEAEKEAEVVLNFSEELLPVLTEASRYVAQSTTRDSVLLSRCDSMLWRLRWRISCRTPVRERGGLERERGGRREREGGGERERLSLIHISEPTRPP